MLPVPFGWRKSAASLASDRGNLIALPRFGSQTSGLATIHSGTRHRKVGYGQPVPRCRKRFQLPGVPLQFGEIVERIGAVEFAGVDLLLVEGGVAVDVKQSPPTLVRNS